MMPAMTFIDFARLRDTPLCRDPFDFVVVENFLAPDRLPTLLDAFPGVPGHGSYPLPTVDCPPAFSQLIDELEGDDLRREIEAKFGLDLSGRPTMITLRGYGDGRDGGIHTDSATKLVTVLIYMNREWTDPAGRLRLLRRPDDIEDFVVEVPPVAGTMLAFRRSDASFHGHRAHVGRRQSIQLNWVTDMGVVRRELRRHMWSARLKALNPLGHAMKAVGK